MKARKRITALCVFTAAALLLLTACSSVSTEDQDTAAASGDTEELAESGLTQIDAYTESTETEDESTDQPDEMADQSEEKSDETEDESDKTGEISETEDETETEGEAETEGESGKETALLLDDEDAFVLSDETEEQENTDGTDYFEGQFVVTISDTGSALNIRQDPDTDSKWVGRLYEGGGGTVLETADGWTRVDSGGVTGWVSSDYILTGDAGIEKLTEDDRGLVIEVMTDAVKVRSEPTTEEENKIRPIYEGETYPLVSIGDGWYEIEYSTDKTGWVTAEYTRIRYGYDVAKSRKTIEDEEAAQKKAAASASKSSSGSSSASSSTTTRAAQSSTPDDTTLLAGLIQCEAGSYDGMLAVANVIINRVNSSGYPNSISGVIYQSGQFGPASNGDLAAVLKSGPSSTAKKAASAALGGTNNIGSYVHFRSASGADLSKYSSYTIVGGNLFY